MDVTVNGVPREVLEGTTLQQLLSELHITPTRVACEVNLKIVKRAHYPELRLAEGDAVEIVQMVAGG
ncbi:MAG: sulfur carrier protein ThiS [Elusimicrobia bacterium]|nr:sulfur carrier protein ThiS [Elusimicrobiota bacterium]